MKCNHNPCKCEGTLDRGGKKYCSEACVKTATGGTAGKCGCGHPSCGKGAGSRSEKP
jgi:hypothetical protein